MLFTSHNRKRIKFIFAIFAVFIGISMVLAYMPGLFSGATGVGF